MKKKSKGEQIDFVGVKKEKKKKEKVKKKSNARKSSNKIKLDNEIFIGLTPIAGVTQKPEEKKQKDEKKKQTKKSDKKQNKTIKTKKQHIQKQKPQKKKRTKTKVVVWTSIILVVIIGIILLLLFSPIFNMNTINVTGNSKVTSSEIIEASGIITDKNMFTLNIGKAKQNIKKNAYISNAAIRRGIDGTVTINVKERTPSYIITMDTKYVYIDNQGYMLEVAEQALNLPNITGYKTDNKDIAAGNRLNVEDLMKLNTCINIMSAAKGNGISDLITNIDISDVNEYTLTMQTKGLIIHFGDNSRINDKMLWIITIMGKINGAQGEIFLNSTRPYFHPN